MLWWVFRWNPPLSMYHYHLLQCDWFCWAIIIYHDEGYCRHNSSLDNNLHTIAICPDVVRTSGALLRRIVRHASCHPLGFFICKGRAAADRTMTPFVEIHPSMEKWSLAAFSGVISVCGIRHCNYITQPRSFAWHPSGGLWRYSRGWNESNTTGWRWKGTPYAFTCCTSKNRNCIGIFSKSDGQRNHLYQLNLLSLSHFSTDYQGWFLGTKAKY